MADVKEKLAELIAKAKRSMWGKSGLSSELARNMYLAENLIAHGVRLEEKQATSDGWISVKDRLPEEMRAVIVWTKDRARGEAWLAEDGFEWCESGERADVTHWMEFPQPPKGE
jgi:hypothetical protein